MPGIPLTRVWPCHVKRDGRDKPGHDSWVCLSTQGVRRLEHFPLELTGRDAPATPLAPPLPACGERSDSERSSCGEKDAGWGGVFASLSLSKRPLTRLASRKCARKSTSPRTRGEVERVAPPRAGDRDALTLAAGELVRTFGRVLAQAQRG